MKPGLDAEKLAEPIEDRLITLFRQMLSDRPVTEEYYAREFAKIVAEETVKHIQENAKVDVTISEGQTIVVPNATTILQGASPVTGTITTPGVVTTGTPEWTAEGEIS